MKREAHLTFICLVVVVLLVAEPTKGAESTGLILNVDPCGSTEIYSNCPLEMQKSFINRAYEDAKIDHKQLAVSVGANWCPYCRALDEDLLELNPTTEEVPNTLLLKLNGNIGGADMELTTAQELIDHLFKKLNGGPGYEIRGIPTTLIVDPSSNQFVGPLIGILDADKFISSLNRSAETGQSPADSLPQE